MIIAIACSVAATVGVVAVLVVNIVMLVKTWSRKRVIDDHEADDFGQNDFEAANDFSGGLVDFTYRRRQI